ncbi:hypothetical protein O181_033720 [Austropuccinia psidii MF-1]|uniref:Uncharacterized protein n=1 Tax=Austropuccinia psidii MF-1 TaxID=1389203 RepID=A0A9Q3H9H7_9BASI|nr:hypothetical protein [Austropuccinia psidii MF-1]
MAMARGHSSLGQSSPCLVTHGIQKPKTKPTKSPPKRLTHSTYASQANPVAPDGQRTYPAHIEPPIPGPIPSSKPPEDVPTCEPEPEVAPTQSMEDPFACPTTPRSIIIVDNTPVRSLPPQRTPRPPPLIPTMTLARNLPTYDQL